jgi:hypothetical protein
MRNHKYRIKNNMRDKISDPVWDQLYFKISDALRNRARQIIWHPMTGNKFGIQLEKDSKVKP